MGMKSMPEGAVTGMCRKEPDTMTCPNCGAEHHGKTTVFGFWHRADGHWWHQCHGGHSGTWVRVKEA